MPADADADAVADADRGDGDLAGLEVRDVVAPLTVAVLLFAGFFKGTPALAWLPFDLTVVAAAAVLLGSVVALPRRNPHVSQTQFIALIVAGLLLLVGLMPPEGGPYARNARLGVGLVALSVVGSLALVRGYRRQQVWVWIHVVVGVALVATGRGQLSAGDRFSLVGGNSIAAGQASGVAAMVLVVLMLTGGISIGKPLVWGFAAAIAVSLVTALLLTGSRGPVVAAGASVLAVAAFSPTRGRARRIGSALLALYLAALGLGRLTDAGAARLKLALSGRVDNAQSRRPLWEAAADWIPDHPWGLGWGNSYKVLGDVTGGFVRQYPHNVVLEAALEGGWSAAAGMIVFILVGLRRLQKASTHAYGAALFGIGLFFVISSMVSGSIADNRAMFAAVAMGFMVAPPPDRDQHNLRQD